MTPKSNKDNELETSKIIDYKFKGIGLTTAERHQGDENFEQYCKHYHIDNFSDKKLLESLVYREILQERYQRKIGKLAKSKVKKSGKKGEKDQTVTTTEIIPAHILRALDENLDKILTLKERLGLFSEKKEEDPYKYIQILKKKFAKWREDNQGSRTFACPYCSKMVMLKIRMESWEALQHPFFKDRILANQRLWELFQEGKITKLDISLVLGVSEDYVEWLKDKIYLKDSK